MMISGKDIVYILLLKKGTEIVKLTSIQLIMDNDIEDGDVCIVVDSSQWYEWVILKNGEAAWRTLKPTKEQEIMLMLMKD